jgi:REP element-mobilizing transposase RayT
MQGLSSLYVHYLRGTQSWVGHVFQSRYKCKIIKTDKYLSDILKYLKENPVKAGLVEKAEDFKWLKLYAPGHKKASTKR